MAPCRCLDGDGQSYMLSRPRPADRHQPTRLSAAHTSCYLRRRLQCPEVQVDNLEAKPQEHVAECNTFWATLAKQKPVSGGLRERMQGLGVVLVHCQILLRGKGLDLAVPPALRAYGCPQHRDYWKPTSSEIEYKRVLGRTCSCPRSEGGRSCSSEGRGTFFPHLRLGLQPVFKSSIWKNERRPWES